MRNILKTVFIATLSIIIAFILISCKTIASDVSSNIEIIEETVEVIEEPDVEEATPEEPAASEQSTTTSVQTASKPEAPAPEPTPAQSQATISEDRSSVVVVQIADTETGISWDGVSPIIYTYPDGTTGTEKRDGATYEGLPGMITTYRIPRDRVGRVCGTICPLCQKEILSVSDVKYCFQTNRDQYCNGCGEYIKAYTCHTCTQEYKYHCDRCGKLGGDGTNGTCASWLADVNCPNCGEHVEAYTCHICGQ